MTQFDHLPELLVRKEVEELLHISHTTLKKWRDNGKLKGINLSLKTGDKQPQWRYLKSEILKLLQQDVVS